MNPITYVMVNIAILCILWFGGWQVQIGSVSQGQIVALVNYMNQILLALVALANLIVAVTRALACAIRINEVFRVNSSMKEGTEEKIRRRRKPRVVFDHVTFYLWRGAGSFSDRYQFFGNAGRNGLESSAVPDP